MVALGEGVAVPIQECMTIRCIRGKRERFGSVGEIPIFAKCIVGISEVQVALTDKRVIQTSSSATSTCLNGRYLRGDLYRLPSSHAHRRVSETKAVGERTTHQREYGKKLHWHGLPERIYTVCRGKQPCGKRLKIYVPGRCYTCQDWTKIELTSS